MKLNIAKFNCISLKHNVQLALKMDNHKSGSAESIKYIRIVIDHELKFDEHIVKKSQKIMYSLTE